MHRLEPLPASIHLRLESIELLFVLGSGHVTGLAHRLQPRLDRDAPANRVRIVGDACLAPLYLVEREEAAVDRRLHHVRAGAVLAPPVQRA